ncbi:hypothetical protein [Burkholderia plantarii]|uniref:hypothetical protein n=1 Tax=Burkholderia plantarii TaxID=41899 RepID=UPI000F4ECCAF|nr:hypothetical protein [Burkholderia plantarii]
MASYRSRRLPALAVEAVCTGKRDDDTANSSQSRIRLIRRIFHSHWETCGHGTASRPGSLDWRAFPEIVERFAILTIRRARRDTRIRRRGGAAVGVGRPQLARGGFVDTANAAATLRDSVRPYARRRGG